MTFKEIIIPEALMTIKYNGRIIPNGKSHDMKITGANCQVFAYHILRLNGLTVPEYRSSELWADSEYSEVIRNDFQPLDLLFFHNKETAYGAHIAISIGNNQALHLSKAIGLPVIWDISTFLEQEKYKFLIGGKRFC